eukprot:TRINITY_DN10226_c0_g1_i1.p1 TRINITY_DN10226_c0_g1~~TRINITY_DN10226_c0_g1_i1.p1  ORF type:complete len:1476 (+),score=349.68 TRINITY_DN10226_c0_g1_i1:581-4429(+)
MPPSEDFLEDECAELPRPADLRVRWSPPSAFAVATAGAVCGFASFWRFPYLCLQYGGGSFVVAYALSMATIALPLLVLEMSVGQRWQRGILRALQGVHGALGGVGIICAGAAFFSLCYLATVMGWAGLMFVGSCNNPLPWEPFGRFETIYDPNNTARNCTIPPSVTVVQLVDRTTTAPDGTVTTEVGRLLVQQNTDPLKSPEYLSRCGICTDASSYYFYHTAIRAMNDWCESAAYTSTGVASGRSFGALSVALFFVAAGAAMGIRTVAVSSYITVTVSVIALTLLCLRVVTLSGADTGVEAFMGGFEWAEMERPHIWADAAAHSLLTTTAAYGVAAAFASHRPRNAPLVAQAVAVCVYNFLYSLAAGLAVYGLAGALQERERLDCQQHLCDDIARDANHTCRWSAVVGSAEAPPQGALGCTQFGSRLAAFPECADRCEVPIGALANHGIASVFALLPRALWGTTGAGFFSAMLFLTLWVLGWDTCVAMVEAIATSIFDDIIAPSDPYGFAASLRRPPPPPPPPSPPRTATPPPHGSAMSVTPTSHPSDPPVSPFSGERRVSRKVSMQTTAPDGAQTQPAADPVAFPADPGEASALQSSLGRHWLIRALFVAVLWAAAQLLGLLYAADIGLYWVDLSDHYITSYLLPVAALLQSAGVAWCLAYRSDRKKVGGTAAWALCAVSLLAALCFVGVASGLGDDLAPCEETQWRIEGLNSTGHKASQWCPLQSYDSCVRQPPCIVRQGGCEARVLFVGGRPQGTPGRDHTTGGVHPWRAQPHYSGPFRKETIAGRDVYTGPTALLEACGPLFAADLRDAPGNTGFSYADALRLRPCVTPWDSACTSAGEVAVAAGMTAVVLALGWGGAYAACDRDLTPLEFLRRTLLSGVWEQAEYLAAVHGVRIAGTAPAGGAAWGLWLGSLAAVLWCVAVKYFIPVALGFLIAVKLKDDTDRNRGDYPGWMHAVASTIAAALFVGGVVYSAVGLARGTATWGDADEFTNDAAPDRPRELPLLKAEDAAELPQEGAEAEDLQVFGEEVTGEFEALPFVPVTDVGVRDEVLMLPPQHAASLAQDAPGEGELWSMRRPYCWGRIAAADSDCFTVTFSDATIAGDTVVSREYMAWAVKFVRPALPPSGTLTVYRGRIQRRTLSGGPTHTSPSGRLCVVARQRRSGAVWIRESGAAGHGALLRVVAVPPPAGWAGEGDAEGAEWAAQGGIAETDETSGTTVLWARRSAEIAETPSHASLPVRKTRGVGGVQDAPFSEERSVQRVRGLEVGDPLVADPMQSI